MAGRTFLQMDQATPANQIILRHLRECRKDSIWIAISVYVLVAIIKKRLHLKTELYTILQILSLTLFENMQLKQLLDYQIYKPESADHDNQLNLFDFLTGQ